MLCAWCVAFSQEEEEVQVPGALEEEEEIDVPGAFEEEVVEEWGGNDIEREASVDSEIELSDTWWNRLDQVG